MKRILLFLLIVTLQLLSKNPQEHWEKHKNPEDVGWSIDSLNVAKAYYDELGSDALLVIYKGKVLIDWGDISRRYMLHSARKSLLSALFGIHVDRGEIDVNENLAQLGIDDKDKLTDKEKEATILDMLKARSGVYHPAAYEAPQMRALRPARGSHEHNTFWYYNNWDFNTLCTILEQKTGKDIFVDFKDEFASPLQMEDYRVMDGYHHLEAEYSIHPAYPFKMSAKDMARFGLLFCNDGVWNDKQILSKEWVDKSSASYSETPQYGPFGYGYLWWTQDSLVSDTKLYSAMGVGTQTISVMPDEDLVFVHRVNTYDGNRVSTMDILKLYQKVFNGKVGSGTTEPETEMLKEHTPWYTDEIVEISKDEYSKYIGSYYFYGQPATVEYFDDSLVLKSSAFGNFKLLPIDEETFLMQDYEKYLLFFKNEEGVYSNLIFVETIESMPFIKGVISEDFYQALTDYRDKLSNGNSQRLGEEEINSLGYQLLGLSRLNEAIEIFKLNVEMYPNSANAYDSLGEAFMYKGDKEQAIKNYEKSLELNPQNSNAAANIERLKAN